MFLKYRTAGFARESERWRDLRSQGGGETGREVIKIRNWVRNSEM